MLNIAVLVACLLVANLFAQLGNSYEMLSVYATAEGTEETSSPTETVTENTVSPGDFPTATAEPTMEITSAPEETSSPGKTENPDNTASTEPGATDEPETTDEPSESPENTTPDDAGSVSETPDTTGSAEVTVTPTNTARPTPSPTLAGIEAPYVSGDVFIDVEDENYTPTMAPIGTASSDIANDDSATIQSAKPENAVKDKGGMSIFFDKQLCFH